MVRQETREKCDGLPMTEPMQREDVVCTVDHLICDQSEHD